MNEIEEAVRVLKRGGVIVYPTETSYGLGADYTNKRAVKKIFKIKKRADKKLAVIVSSLFVIKKYALIDEDAEKLSREFMPGPLTLVVRKKEKGTLAFRISSNEIAFSISKKFKKPIIATSANISGSGDNYEIKKIKEIFEDKVDLIIDGGNLRKRKPSTIYDVENHKILRTGSVTEKMIKKVILSEHQS